jgi:hypothetical protein
MQIGENHVERLLQLRVTRLPPQITPSLDTNPLVMSFVAAQPDLNLLTTSISVHAAFTILFSVA